MCLSVLLCASGPVTEPDLAADQLPVVPFLSHTVLGLQTHAAMAFTWGVGIQTQVLKLSQQALSAPIP